MIQIYKKKKEEALITAQQIIAEPEYKVKMNQLTEEQPQRREGGVGKSAFVHLILVLFGDKQDLRDMGESLSTKTLLSRPPPPKKSTLAAASTIQTSSKKNTSAMSYNALLVNSLLG